MAKSFNFRDEALELVSRGAWPQMLKANVNHATLLNNESFLIDAVRLNPPFVLGLENPSEDVVVEAIKADKTGVVFENEDILKNQTERICIAAVQKSYHNLARVQEQTPAVCMAAVEGYPDDEMSGYAILDVKKEFRTPELIQKAVSKTAVVVRFVPRDELTDEICMAAIHHSPDDILELQGYPVKPEMYIAAFERQEEIFKEKAQKREANGNILTTAERDELTVGVESFCTDVFDRLSQQEIISIVKCDPMSLRFVPADRIKASVIDVALSAEGKSVQYVPQKKLTSKLCELAVKQDPEAIRFLPPAYLSLDILSLVLEDPANINMLKSFSDPEQSENLLDVCEELGLTLKTKNKKEDSKW